MHIEIQIDDPPHDGWAAGYVWVENGRVVIQGFRSSNDELRRLLPWSIQDPETDETVTPEAGENGLSYFPTPCAALFIGLYM